MDSDSNRGDGLFDGSGDHVRRGHSSRAGDPIERYGDATDSVGCRSYSPIVATHILADRAAASRALLAGEGNKVGFHIRPGLKAPRGKFTLGDQNNRGGRRGNVLQNRFDLREELLDRIEVRPVGRKIEGVRALRLDGFSRAAEGRSGRAWNFASGVLCDPRPRIIAGGR